jgi:hypothetical protein
LAILFWPCTSPAQTKIQTSQIVTPVLFVDGVQYKTLASAYAACPAQGCYIFDTFQETLAANPFSTCQAINANVKILLSTNIITNVPIQIKCNGTIIVGTGRSGSVGFVAGASFPASSTLLEIGNAGTAFISSTRLEDLTLSCNANTTCTPFLGSGLAENSGLRNVAAVNYFGTGILLNSGFTTNFTIENIVSSPAAAATTAIGLQISSVPMDGNHIKQITVVPIPGGHLTDCIDVENASVSISDVHCENSTTGVLINNSRYLIVGYNTGQAASGAITDHIKITGTSSGTILDENSDNPAYGTNLINNTTTGFTLPVATTGKLISYWSATSVDGECYAYSGLGGLSCAGTLTGKSVGATSQFTVNGSVGGSITLKAPATAGTNTITYPAATGTSSLDVVEYCGATSGGTQACAKTVQTLPIIVWGDVLLNTATSQSITTLPFTDALYSCTGSDLTTIAGIVSFNTYASASVTVQEFGGVNTDHLRYVCVGH